MLPISDILIRSLCGFGWMAPVLTLFFLWRRKSGRREQGLHVAAVFLFCYYLLGVLTVTGIGYTSTIAFRPRFSLVPFRDMLTGPVDTILNVVLFVPLGFFLPLLYPQDRRLRAVFLAGFLFSLSIEGAQMFGWGTTDVNDLITNTAGTCLGYGAWALVAKGLPQAVKQRLQSERSRGNAETALLIAGTFLTMITAQPWTVHHLLHIG